VRDRRLAVPVAVAGAMGFMLWSVVWQREYMGREAAVWQVADAMVAQGVDPSLIEAGYEWDGVHRGDAAIAHAAAQVDPVRDPDGFIKIVIDDLYRRTGWSVDLRLPPRPCPDQVVGETTYGQGWPVYGLRACQRFQNARPTDGAGQRPPARRRPDAPPRQLQSDHD